MDSELKEYVDAWFARRERDFDNLMALLGALPSTADHNNSTPAVIADGVVGPVLASSATAELVTASTGLADPPALVPTTEKSLVVTSAVPIGTMAIVPASCSTECAAQAVTVSTMPTLLLWASRLSSSPATSSPPTPTEYSDRELFRPSPSQRFTSRGPVHRPMPWPSFTDIQADGDETRPIPWPSFKEVNSCDRESPSDDIMKASQWCSFDTSSATIVVVSESQFPHCCYGRSDSSYGQPPYAILVADAYCWPGYFVTGVDMHVSATYSIRRLLLISSVTSVPSLNLAKILVRPKKQHGESLSLLVLYLETFSNMLSELQHWSTCLLRSVNEVQQQPWPPSELEVLCFIDINSCQLINTRAKWCFNAPFSGVQEGAPDIQCVNHACVPSYALSWHERTTNIILLVLVNGSVLALFFSASPHSFWVADLIEGANQFKCTKRAQGSNVELLAETAVSQNIGACCLLGTFSEEEHCSSCNKLLSEDKAPDATRGPYMNHHSRLGFVILGVLITRSLTSLYCGNTTAVQSSKETMCSELVCYYPGFKGMDVLDMQASKFHDQTQWPPWPPPWCIWNIHEGHMFRSRLLSSFECNQEEIESATRLVQSWLGPSARSQLCAHSPGSNHMQVYNAAGQVDHILVQSDGAEIYRLLTQPGEYLNLCLQPKPPWLSILSKIDTEVEEGGGHPHGKDIKYVRLMLFSLLLRRPYSELPIEICVHELHLTRRGMGAGLCSYESTSRPLLQALGITDNNKKMELCMTAREPLILQNQDHGWMSHGFVLLCCCRITLLSAQGADEEVIVTRKHHRVLVQHTKAPWDPGGSTWCRWFSTCDDHEPFQGGRNVIGVTTYFEQFSTGHKHYLDFASANYCMGAFFDWVPVDQNDSYSAEVYPGLGYYRDCDQIKEHRLQWDPGGFSVVSAWGQAEFQGGRDVRSLYDRYTYMGWSLGPSHGPAHLQGLQATNTQEETTNG